MTAESSRKPSTEPARSPVENARLLLPQLTAGQRAVVGALIAECERGPTNTIATAAEWQREAISLRAQLAEATRERDALAMDAIDAIANASRSRDKHAYIRTVVAPDDAASDDPHGLGEGWVYENGAAWWERWAHESGVYVQRDGTLWFALDEDGNRIGGVTNTAREAAALALVKPTVAREIDWDAIDDASCAVEQAYPFQRDVMAMLRALVDELVRTGAIAGKDGGK